MTSAQDALLVPLGEPLGDFEGLEEVQAGAVIPGAAGGLRAAMKVDGRRYRQGQRLAVVLDCTVASIHHDPIDKEEPDGLQRRVHVLTTEGATIVSRDLVAVALDAQAARITAAKEEEERLKREEKGTPHLTDDEAFKLAEAHAAGKHAELVDGCEACDLERDTADREAAEDAKVDGEPSKPDWGPGSGE